MKNENGTKLAAKLTVRERKQEKAAKIHYNTMTAQKLSEQLLVVCSADILLASLYGCEATNIHENCREPLRSRRAI